MNCPECDSPATHEDGTDNIGNQWYECEDCGEQFSELDAD